MANRTLARSDWQSYCDHIAASLEGMQAQIEIVGLPGGHRITANWVPLIGISYDPNDDVFEIAITGLDHLINKPTQVIVEEQTGGLASLQIVNADGYQQTVRFREPLLLAPPKH